MYRDGGGFFKSVKLQIAKHLIRLNIQTSKTVLKSYYFPGFRIKSGMTSGGFQLRT